MMLPVAEGILTEREVTVIRTVAIILSAVIFTIMGMLAGLMIVVNRPRNFSDPEGLITMAMVIVPTAGGLIAGVIVGIIAARMSDRGPPSSAYKQ